MPSTQPAADPDPYGFDVEFWPDEPRSDRRSGRYGVDGDRRADTRPAGSRRDGNAAGRSARGDADSSAGRSGQSAGWQPTPGGRAARRTARAAGELARPPVRPGAVLAAAAAAAITAAALVVGAKLSLPAFAGVVLALQAGYVLAWLGATRPPGPYVVGAVGLVIAAAADAGAIRQADASVAPLGYALAGAFLLAGLGQLARRRRRTAVTAALGSSLALAVAVVGYGFAAVLVRHAAGPRALIVCAVAAGATLVVARVTDLVAPVPRLAPEVARGALGMALGVAAGTIAAAVAGVLSPQLSVGPAALAGLATALTAVLGDLVAGYGSAAGATDGGSAAAEHRPTVGLAVAVRGPLTALATALPVAYVASVLLLVRGL